MLAFYRSKKGARSYVMSDLAPSLKGSADPCDFFFPFQEERNFVLFLKVHLVIPHFYVATWPLRGKHETCKSAIKFRNQQL